MTTPLTLPHLGTRAALTALIYLLAALATAPAYAQQTMYVSDQVFIPLRTGQGTQYRIRMNLKTGQPLSVIELPEDGQWAHVTTEGGTDGWVPTQYLTREPPAQLQLESAQKKIQQLEEQLTKLKQQTHELDAHNRELTQNVSSESQSRDALNQELEHIKSVSADSIAIADQNQALIAQNNQLTADKEKLATENTVLKHDQRLEFMLYSAGLVLLGILLAFAVPALKPKKRNSEWR